MELQDRFAEYLRENHLGRSRSISSVDLRAQGFGIPQMIRGMVNNLRRDGVPICSSLAGYFYGETEDEVKETLLFLDVYMRGLRSAHDGLLQSLPNLNRSSGEWRSGSRTGRDV